MRRALFLTIFAVLAALGSMMLSAPACAASTAIPEPSTTALFAMGVVGVLVGRHGSRRRKD